jgi:hypothetical protein
MDIPIEEFRRLKSQVSSIEGTLLEVHGAIVGNPLSKDGGLTARLTQAEVEIELIKGHVDDMEKKQIKDLLQTEKTQATQEVYTKVMWSALGGVAMLILAYILK